MREQLPAGQGIPVELACIKNNVAADDVCACAQPTTGPCRIRPVVNAHLAQIVCEHPLHEGAAVGMKGPSWSANDFEDVIHIAPILELRKGTAKNC
ncbi:MAG: hypothetical protein NVSMB18_20050 [Acetobacteraceae bacterium]